MTPTNRHPRRSRRGSLMVGRTLAMTGLVVVARQRHGTTVR